MKFSTVVDIEPTTFRLLPASRVVLLGSCFAEEIGMRLADSLPDGHVVVNPCGVLYNPESIAQTIGLMLMEEGERSDAIGDSVFLARDGRWHSWLFGTKTTGETQSECHARGLASLAVDLGKTALLVITLGTDHCYQLRADGRVVANCHKEPAALFHEVVVPSSLALRQSLKALLQRCPSLEVLVTVSPYRYAKYGFHTSQLSKSRLLLLADDLCRSMPRVTYFPAYEILLDELRDYRFYAADMLHPSEQAADYIFERFRDWCFSPELTAYAAERLKQLKASRHRPQG